MALNAFSPVGVSLSCASSNISVILVCEVCSSCLYFERFLLRSTISLSSLFLSIFYLFGVLYSAYIKLHKTFWLKDSGGMVVILKSLKINFCQICFVMKLSSE